MMVRHLACVAIGGAPAGEVGGFTEKSVVYERQEKG